MSGPRVNPLRRSDGPGPSAGGQLDLTDLLAWLVIGYWKQFPVSGKSSIPAA